VAFGHKLSSAGAENRTGENPTRAFFYIDRLRCHIDLSIPFALVRSVTLLTLQQKNQKLKWIIEKYFSQLFRIAGRPPG
jgi:hypothetical protein